MTDEVQQFCFLGNGIVFPYSSIEVDMLFVSFANKGKFRRLGSLESKQSLWFGI